MSDRHDVIIIGAGPGGYVCAIRCAQLGLKVAVVERRRKLGGTCLNVGCIPSKALLHVAERFHETQESYAAMGIVGCTPRIDVAQMMAHKQQVVQANTRGIAYLFKKNGITHIHGSAEFLAPDTLRVSNEEQGEQLLSAGAIVIATGSEPAPLPQADFDEEVITSSTGALSFTRVPASLAVVGGGVIGLELGALWARLGAAVTIIEYEERLLPGWDADIAKALTRELKRQGMKVKTGTAVASLHRNGDGATLELQLRADGKPTQTLKAEKVLIAIGRRPFTQGLNLERIGVHTDEKGFIPVDERFQTERAGVYAIGDVIGGPMLAHKAEEEGLALAELLAGRSAEVNYALIPSVLYTTPEAASIGFTEEELQAAGVEYKVGTFRFQANGRARAMLATAGFVKLLIHTATGRILGAHLLGPMAGELVHEIAAAMHAGLQARDLAHMCHAHPTLSEVVREAALAANDKPLHA